MKKKFGKNFGKLRIFIYTNKLIKKKYEKNSKIN